ncbi:MAG: CoA-binding protein [Rhodobacteraceae bacterium]|nr:CoA-binding protein [Paracoccaceae bacterium]
MADYDDSILKRILAGTKVIAMVGLSPDPLRPSYFVGRYLSLKGYRVIPVNPKAAGQRLFGEVAVATLAEAGPDVDMVDIFRKSEAVPGIVEEAIQVLPNLKTVWMQIGVESAQAAAMAEARGIDVVQDRCPKIEHQRLFGELRKAGFATGVISSKL